MSLFDLPAPVFGAVDQLFAGFVPTGVRVAAWGLVGAVASMWLYWRLSPQEKIAEASTAAADAKKEMAAFDGEFEEMRPLLAKMLSTSLRHLGLALGPALLASFPLIFLLAWVGQSFGFRVPSAGEEVTVETVPAGSSLSLDDSGAVVEGHFRWPAQPAALRDGQGTVLLRVPPHELAPVIDKHRWWNYLLGNGMGYLPPETDVQAIQFGLSRQRVLSFGPSWMGTWEFGFFTTMVLASIAIKVVFRIK